ncbi:MAG: metalloregulator ArsR/SmtB family transcription factor [Bacillota bacterium]|nr:metalloregulator ArsR/SmtB family transcription factor [Bacillota bacterium]
MGIDHQRNATIFKALCDANRLTILELLQTGEHCACHLLDELRISQPTLSHHMKILTESGLVRGRKEGRWTYYSLDAEGIAHAKEIFDAVTAVVPNPVPVCACAD